MIEVRHITEKDAAEAAELISQSIQYADAEAKRRTGDVDALAFPPALNRVWSAADVLGHKEKFDTSAAMFEDGRMMAVVIAHHGGGIFRPIIGGTRIDAIKPEQHEAYLYYPLRLLAAEAIAAGITEQETLYDPQHVNLDDSLKRFPTKGTVEDRGALRAYRSPLVLGEIRAMSVSLDTRSDTGRSS